MIRRIGFVGLTLGLWLAMAAGLSLAPGCYNVPEPVCGFFCGSSGACPDDYTCMADNRCHLKGAPATMCFSIDAGPSDTPDAPGDTPFEGINQPPTVVSTNPSANATNVAISTNVTVTFSEGVTNVSGTTFTVTQGGNPVSGTVAYSPTNFIASFTPGAALLPNTVYAAQVTSGISDLQGAPLTATSWTFTTAADTTAPMVVSTTPAANATGVAVTSTVQAIFTEPVINATMTTFTLAAGATPISGTVTTSALNSSATFTPSAPLPANTVLTATLTAGITDAAGNPLASAPVTWMFTTGADTVAPTLISTTPASSATGVGVSSAVVATFSEAVANASATTFTLKDGATTIPGTVTTSTVNKTATFTPTAALPASTVLTATLTTGITDLAANPLVSAPIVWTFTTGTDTVGPTAVTTTPATGATGVAATSTVVVQFDEAVANATTTTFSLKNGATAISGTVTTSAVNKTATFTPTGQLPANTLITATLTSALTDLAGNPLTSAPVTWTFTTAPDTTAPMVVTRSPAASATGVALNATVVATFDEAVNATMSSFTLTSGGSPILGVVTTNTANKTATFTPMLPLPTNTVLTATLTAGVTDLAGNPLAAAPVSWSFTTVPDTVAPMLVSTSPAANTTGVSIVAPIVATFDEAVINANTTTFALTVGGTPVTGTVTTNMVNKTATFTPAGQLPGNTLITITLTAGITDAAGNPLAAAPITRTFTTGADAVSPSFVSSNPASGATLVATSTTITATFNEPMANVTTSTFLVNDGASVSGSLTSTMGTRVWTFQPLLTLTAATTVMVTLTTGITDTAGNPLAAPVTFSFMTQ